MKKKLYIVMFSIIIALVAFFFVYRYYNKEDKTTTLTVTEKRWVETNKDQTFDFEVVNDYPLYGTNGEGVIFDFLKDFKLNLEEAKKDKQEWEKQEKGEFIIEWEEKKDTVVSGKQFEDSEFIIEW